MLTPSKLIDNLSSREWLASNYPDLEKELSSYLEPKVVEDIKKAYLYSACHHYKQRRKSGEAYINHPVAVSITLAQYKLDPATIKAALLHDVVEDTHVSVEELSETFGKNVAIIVDGVSKLDKLDFKSAKEAQAESLRKMILAMTNDLRVILVKLADRLHNIRTIDAVSPEKRRIKARETLEIYAPIANRLGMYQLKGELEDLGFKALSPYRYKILERAINKAHTKQEKSLNNVRSQLLAALEAEGINAEITIREKRLYSIYSKMKKKHLSLAEILDVYGLRVVLDNESDCYRALGVIHRYFKPIPGKFKDYISIPRVNGYQSLHTTLFGPNALPLEVQIRTKEMDWVAERGVASHWKHKAIEQNTHSSETNARNWLNDLVAMQKNANSEEFLEAVKIDLFPDKVYVFSPKGDVIRLPKGSTPIDFAYAIHTELGNKAISAKVDRQIVPLRSELKNGSKVEIVTSKDANPNPHWITFVATAKARNAIRSKLKEMNKEDAIKSGKSLLTRALLPHKLTLRNLKGNLLNRILVHYKCEKIDDLYELLGNGSLIATLVAMNIAAGPDAVNFAPASRDQLEIIGTEGLSTNFANCCHPIPGDEILGFISSGKGIVVHRAECKNVGTFKKDQSRWLSVNWGPNIIREFYTDISVRTKNKVGILAEIAGNISSLNSNIMSTEVETQGDSTFIYFTLSVRNRRHLADILRSIRTSKEVMRVIRGRHQ